MKIELIDFGAGTKGHFPKRAHAFDAGADVFAPYKVNVKPNETAKIPLGFGVKIPQGFAGYIFPRSSTAKAGVTCHVPPIDCGYTGEIHAVLTCHSDYAYLIEEGDKIGQLVIMPCVIADFVTEMPETRGANGFGSTGK